MANHAHRPARHEAAPVMTIHHGFAPDSERAAAIDRRMHAELGASLRHVLARIDAAISFERPALQGLIEDLDHGVRYPPIAFGTYYELVLRLLDDDLEGARPLLADLGRVNPSSADQRVVPLEPPADSDRSRLYREKLLPDTDGGVSIQAPDPATVRRFEEEYTAALQLLEAAVPELAGEIRALVHEVIPVVGAPDDTSVFEGASHYQLWGALFLNAAPTDNRVKLAEMIAHESGHGFLFGCCVDEPLVYNDDDELHPSPLRSDPRPMDGIYHATFVSARMHWTLSRLLDSGELTADEVVSARAARDADARNFADGDAVIRAQARLSRVGSELIDGARAWMAEHAR